MTDTTQTVQGIVDSNCGKAVAGDEESPSSIRMSVSQLLCTILAIPVYPASLNMA